MKPDLIDTKALKLLYQLPTPSHCVNMRLGKWLTAWNQAGQVEWKDGSSVKEIEIPYSEMTQMVNHGV